MCVRLIFIVKFGIIMFAILFLLKLGDDIWQERVKKRVKRLERSSKQKKTTRIRF